MSNAPSNHETAIPAIASTSPVRSRIWDVPFDHVTLGQAVDRIDELINEHRTHPEGKPSFAITANLNYCMLHNRDHSLQPITRQADLILADGHPIVARSLLSHRRLPERVAGSEMIFDLSKRCAQRGWSIYFLGGEPGVAQKCADRLVELNPQLQVAGVESPPFRTLTPEEQQQQDERIKNSGADLLLVAFGQPKGEKWIFENYKRLNVGCAIQLGASFDFVAGTARRAPIGWQRLGLEWMYRMLSDPRRLIPRYAANAAFLFGALIDDWRQTVTGWGMGQWTEKPPEPSRRQFPSA